MNAVDGNQNLMPVGSNLKAVDGDLGTENWEIMRGEVIGVRFEGYLEIIPKPAPVMKNQLQNSVIEQILTK